MSIRSFQRQEEEETKTKEDSKYPYKTVDEAVAYIKRTRKKLADAKRVIPRMMHMWQI